VAANKKIPGSLPGMLTQLQLTKRDASRPAQNLRSRANVNHQPAKNLSWKSPVAVAVFRFREQGSFLRDPAGEAGFVRFVGMVSARTDSPYRWTLVAADRDCDHSDLS
jgi:hypothetical protein